MRIRFKTEESIVRTYEAEIDEPMDYGAILDFVASPEFKDMLPINEAVLSEEFQAGSRNYLPRWPDT